MAKEKNLDKEERSQEKRAKKEKRSETDGVHKCKKDKKEKKRTIKIEATEVTGKLLSSLKEGTSSSLEVKGDGIAEPEIRSAPLLGALVPFANPLADEKVQKKVLKSVKKGTQHAFPHPPSS